MNGEVEFPSYDRQDSHTKSQAHTARNVVQRGVNLFELSWEKVSARLQPATAGHARLVLSKQLEQIYTSLYVVIISPGGEQNHMYSARR